MGLQFEGVAMAENAKLQDFLLPLVLAIDKDPRNAEPVPHL